VALACEEARDRLRNHRARIVGRRQAVDEAADAEMDDAAVQAPQILEIGRAVAGACRDLLADRPQQRLGHALQVAPVQPVPGEARPPEDAHPLGGEDRRGVGLVEAAQPLGQRRRAVAQPLRPAGRQAAEKDVPEHRFQQPGLACEVAVEQRLRDAEARGEFARRAAEAHLGEVGDRAGQDLLAAQFRIQATPPRARRDGLRCVHASLPARRRAALDSQ
jgi:hypothetical protein